MNDENSTFVSIGQTDIDASILTAEPNVDDLPILATRNLVLFPVSQFPYLWLGKTHTIPQISHQKNNYR